MTSQRAPLGSPDKEFDEFKKQVLESLGEWQTRYETWNDGLQEFEELRSKFNRLSNDVTESNNHVQSVLTACVQQNGEAKATQDAVMGRLRELEQKIETKESHEMVKQEVDVVQRNCLAVSQAHRQDIDEQLARIKQTFATTEECSRLEQAMAAWKKDLNNQVSDCSDFQSKVSSEIHALNAGMAALKDLSSENLRVFITEFQGQIATVKKETEVVVGKRWLELKHELSDELTALREDFTRGLDEVKGALESQVDASKFRHDELKNRVSDDLMSLMEKSKKDLDELKRAMESQVDASKSQHDDLKNKVNGDLMSLTEKSKSDLDEVKRALESQVDTSKSLHDEFKKRVIDDLMSLTEKSKSDLDEVKRALESQIFKVDASMSIHEFKQAFGDQLTGLREDSKIELGEVKKALESQVDALKHELKTRFGEDLACLREDSKRGMDEVKMALESQVGASSQELKREFSDELTALRKDSKRGLDDVMRAFESQSKSQHDEVKDNLSGELTALREDFKSTLDEVKGALESQADVSQFAHELKREVRDDIVALRENAERDLESVKKDLEDKAFELRAELADTSQALLEGLEPRMNELTRRVDRLVPANRHCKDSLEEMERRVVKLEGRLDNAQVVFPGGRPAPGTAAQPAEAEQATAAAAGPASTAEAASSTSAMDKDADTSASTTFSDEATTPQEAQEALGDVDGQFVPASPRGGESCADRPQDALFFVHPEDPEVRAITANIEKELLRNLGLSQSEKETLLKRLFLKCHPDKVSADSQAMIWYQDWLKANKPWFLSTTRSHT